MTVQASGAGQSSSGVGSSARSRRSLLVGSSSTPVGPPRSAFVTLLAVEAKLYIRSAVGLILGLGLPVLLLVIFGLVPRFRHPMPELDGGTILGLYGPILSAFALAFLGLVSLPIPLAGYRELGVLRRMSCTPAPRSWILGVQLLINLSVGLVALVILNVGIRVFGVGAPVQVGGYALAIVLCVAEIFALGLWIAAVARSAGLANAIGQLCLYPMMFFAGLYFPREMMPSLLRHISDWTPLGAAVHAMQQSAEGSFPSLQPILVMVGYAAVFGLAARKQFRWE
ncbi:MAG: ABC transporter permease [Thermoleophilia bacterium]|nr:ABC transporter permease [Thermoleophilia bacterium]